ncbi:Tim44 domain-containing protein [Geobacter sp. DSM 9736]|uniref:Tim44 domain-containing protein n=1 Tax=Geobacter sp. DSM 9736 TaxID=1277350 RepID=UPI000B4FDCBB|nr:Tim44 domain-containing protein [Geobacter sp. DSM 9736]SNB44983.1 Predicted lipid-binding transport protein, Tim44 family [Geobacter sp. DSM 9736]
MKNNAMKLFVAAVTLLLLAAALPDRSADARAGGGRSSGSRGSRSYSPPNRSYSRPAPAPSRDAFPGSAPVQRQTGSGGFLRSMAGGIVGGVLGGMLFRSLGFGGMGGLGGSGIGLFEIILIAGIGYLIYRMVAKRRAAASAPGYGPGTQNVPSYERPDYREQASMAPAWQASPGEADVQAGISHIRQMDPNFDEGRFKDMVMDVFFKIQGAWMNRNLSGVLPLLTEEMQHILQEDVDRLLREKRINRLENIAVRSVDISEAWQEGGQDFVTALIYANLLDYTVDDQSGAVVAGSNIEPVKFEEYWTFARPVGNNQWRLSAIDQK